MVAPAKRPTEAWHSAGLFERGFGQVIVARFKASGEVEVGVFLVDTFSLGVKDAFFTRLWADEYEQRLLGGLDQQGGREAISPACARRLVEDAVAYARSLGLEPHPDYKQGARVFGGIDPKECTQAFVFGKDGKPLYVQSPHDSEEFTRHVMGTLTRRFGEGGFHYVLITGEDLDEADHEDDDEQEQEQEHEGEQEGPSTPPSKA